MSTRRFRLSMLHVAALVTLGFFGWAGLCEIDQSVRVTGQLIPGARTQVIQAVDGGVLAALPVQEGERVQAGQVVAELEPERAQAAFDENRARRAAIQAALVRARAEAEGQVPSWGEALAAYPALAAAQQQLFQQRRRALDDSLGAVREALALAQEELHVNESLHASGDLSRVELLHAQRQVTELQGKLAELRHRYLQEARAEVAKQEEELAALRHRQEERGNVLKYTQLSSPLDGVVKVLRINTVGGVLRTGEEIMQISPTDGELLVEVRIQPSDIGLLHPGLPVSLQLDAFDYTVYGTVPGSLIYLSADTLTETAPNGQPQTFYRGRVRLDDAAVKAHPKLRGIALKPGMGVTADIRTGQRSVLQYLFSPVLRGTSGALRER
jgi:adhesin transport system membrane fusion protein